MEPKIESDNLIMPADVSVGDAIPEASLRISMKMEGREMGTSTVQWYAKGTGMVKGESYDESGNLSGSVVLAEKF
ncbi:MAG TPA: hypothetical protein VIR29_05060 [Anseongella sp.]